MGSRRPCLRLSTMISSASRLKASRPCRLPTSRATSSMMVHESGTARFGVGSPVLLLHGGLEHSGNWGYQVPALTSIGYRVIVIDSRGHGRSTRDSRPYSYELMASDVLAVLDALRVERAAMVGWR